MQVGKRKRLVCVKCTMPGTARYLPRGKACPARQYPCGRWRDHKLANDQRGEKLRRRKRSTLKNVLARGVNIKPIPEPAENK